MKGLFRVDLAVENPSRPGERRAARNHSVAQLVSALEGQCSVGPILQDGNDGLIPSLYVAISRISMLDPGVMPGISCATWSARS